MQWYAMANKYLEPYPGKYGQEIAQSINNLARNIHYVQTKEIIEIDNLLSFSRLISKIKA